VTPPDGPLPRLAVVTLGDAVLDVVGETSRPLVLDDDVEARVRLVAGGQAANVAAWCAYLGTPAGVITVVGDDPPGQVVRHTLAARGVTVLGPASGGPTGVIVSISSADGNRTMLSDRGVSASLRPHHLRAEWFAGAQWLHLSGYSLFGSAGPDTALAAARLAVGAGARVSVDLSAATTIMTIGPARARQLVAQVAPQLVFANEAEATAIGEIPVPVLVVKRGAGGCAVISGGTRVELPVAHCDEVRDTTGAGDAFAAGWLTGGTQAAQQAARLCISRAGAMPPDVARPWSGHRR
jgi:sugar/nucleoside kinase (ribokinase family)